MNNQAIKCNDEQLLVAIRTDIDELPDSLARHVEKCARCQSRLSELAATGERWRKATSALSPGKSQQSPHNDSTWLGQRCWSERPVAWTESVVKQLLDPPTHPEMLGRLGRYEIEQLIGSGGMGVVFKAYDTELNRPVAIKLLAPQLSESGSARKRFAREARAAAGVVDDHVVPIFNVESDGAPPFLVMQYIAGGSLQETLDRNGPLKVSEILRIGLQAAKGLAAAHAQGLIHRDVKPSNILLDEGVERALLTDFGLARAENDACLTRSGFHPGTPHYMSPEQVRGEAIDGRSDLFGLGCILYAACAGHPPFRAESSYAVLRRVTDESPRPLREVNSEVPQWLEQIVMRLLAKSAEDRYQSAAEVAELLEHCLAHVQRPAAVSLPKSVEELANSFRSRNVNAKRNDSRSGIRNPPISKFVAGAFLSLLLLAGIFITLETGKGTIAIESEVDNVPIVIRKGDEVYEKLIVNRAGASIRVFAGEYQVTFDGEPESMEIDNGMIALSWGDDSVVRICQSSQSENDIMSSGEPLDSRTVPSPAAFKQSGLVGTWELSSVKGKHAKEIIQLNFTLDGRVRLVRSDAKTKEWRYGADAEYLMFISGDDELESPYTQICQWEILDDGHLLLLFGRPETPENGTEMKFTAAHSSAGSGSVSSNHADSTSNGYSLLSNERIHGTWRALGTHDFWLWINSNGTWDSENRYPDRRPLKMSGTWTLEKNNLTTKILESDMESEPVGKVRRLVIHSVDRRKLVVSRGDNSGGNVFFRQDVAENGSNASKLNRTAPVNDGLSRPTLDDPFGHVDPPKKRSKAESLDVVVSVKPIPIETVLWNIAGATFSPALAHEMDPSGPNGGLKIAQLRQAGPAEESRMEVGDIIVSIDSTPIESLAAIDALWRGHDYGKPMQVILLREGRTVFASLKWDMQFLRHLPLARGQILRREGHRVQISFGNDDGVYPGDRLLAETNQLPLAELEVVTALADRLVARIVSEHEQVPVRVGDVVTYGKRALLEPPSATKPENSSGPLDASGSIEPALRPRKGEEFGDEYDLNRKGIVKTANTDDGFTKLPRSLSREHQRIFDHLQGRWRITDMVDDEGNGLAQFDQRHATMVVKGSLLTVLAEVGGRPFRMSLGMQLVGTEIPQAINLLNDPNDLESHCVQLGIIECDRDQLRFCCTSECNPAVSSRPRFFAGGTKTWLIKARRMPINHDAEEKAAAEATIATEHVMTDVIESSFRKNLSR